MKNVTIFSKISIVLDILIYVFFILSGFESNIPYYIYLGLNVFSFLYHYIAVLKEKISIWTFSIYQFVLLGVIALTWYAMLFIGINLQQYHYSVAVAAIVFVVMILDSLLHFYRKKKANKYIEENIEENVEEVKEE